MNLKHCQDKLLCLIKCECLLSLAVYTAKRPVCNKHKVSKYIEIPTSNPLSYKAEVVFNAQLWYRGVSKCLICVFVFYRKKILGEVQSSERNKLPSCKSVLVLGECCSCLTGKGSDRDL